MKHYLDTTRSRIRHCKRAVGKSLTDRAKNIPSSSDNRSKELKHVTSTPVANGYPKRCIIDGSKPKRSPQQCTGRHEKPVHIATHQGYNRADQADFNDIKVTLNPTRLSATYFLNRKTLSQKIRLVALGYSVHCQDCDESYIGEAKRNFASRLKEHRKQ